MYCRYGGGAVNLKEVERKIEELEPLVMIVSYVSRTRVADAKT